MECWMGGRLEGSAEDRDQKQMGGSEEQRRGWDMAYTVDKPWETKVNSQVICPETNHEVSTQKGFSFFFFFSNSKVQSKVGFWFWLIDLFQISETIQNVTVLKTFTFVFFHHLRINYLSVYAYNHLIMCRDAKQKPPVCVGVKCWDSNTNVCLWQQTRNKGEIKALSTTIYHNRELPGQSTSL